MHIVYHSRNALDLNDMCYINRRFTYLLTYLLSVVSVSVCVNTITPEPLEISS